MSRDAPSKKGIKRKIKWKNSFFCLEFKKENNDIVIKDMNECQVINMDGINVKTFSNKLTFLIMVNYFHHFTENIV